MLLLLEPREETVLLWVLAPVHFIIYPGGCTMTLLVDHVTRDIQ